MVCKNCGNKLKENEKFCTSCGTFNDLDSNEEKILMGKSNNDFSLDDDDFPIKEEYDDEDFSIIESQLKKEIKDFKINKKEEKKIIQSKIKKGIEELDLTPKQKQFDNELEQYIEPFIGEDYKIIKKSLINVYALLLNWIYVLYRKLYITGIIGLIITFILLLINPKICLIYIGISMILLGLLFNKYYQIVSTIKVKKILKETNEEDSFKIKKICERKGGVNVIFSLVTFAAFILLYLLIIIIGLPKTKKVSKYIGETSENQANCISITKQSVKDYFKSKTNEIVTEATCRVVDTNPKQFKIILKVSTNNSIYYLYYLADGRYLTKQIDTIDMELLKSKKANLTITSYEETKLQEEENAISEYQDIKNKSNEEDKLIEEGKEKGPKKNFIVDKEEIMR